MELVRFVITSDMRRTVEPLILDALLEYAMRHRASQDASPILHLTLTQAMDVLTAQQSRWHKRLAGVAASLQLHTDGVPRKVGGHLPDLLRSAQEFFRREGAATLKTASATETAEARFSILWTDFFSRCLLDWLREHDLIGDAGYLETADALVECAKLWIRELARLMNSELPAFSDTERDVSITLERGPIKLRVRGRLDAGVIRTVDDGVELIASVSPNPNKPSCRSPSCYCT
jgi:hypothetical protein